MQTSNPSNSSQLAYIVCQWDPSNLPLLSKSFAAACSKPHTKFPAYDDYKSYFEPLLFAEISAELNSALDKFQRVSNPRLSKIRTRREDPGVSVALVAVQKITSNHLYGFGYVIDVEPIDKKGPVGCIDNDVVVVWQSDKPAPHFKASKASPSRHIPNTAVLAIVVRTPTRNGCRLLLQKFPVSNDPPQFHPDPDKPDHPHEKTSAAHSWNLLRLGSLTTMKREFEALQKIRSSVLLPTLLRPHINHSVSLSVSHNGDNPSTAKVSDPRTIQSLKDQPQQPKSPALELGFTNVIVDKLCLNSSQRHAILHSSTCQSGFAVIQGPPGTGKTRTLIGLLNVIHMTQYQKYYEGLLSSLNALHGKKAEPANVVDVSTNKPGEQSFLESMMMAMNRTVEAAMTDAKPVHISSHTRRPRLLICAPSNSAVDEIVTRLISSKFFDGHGRTYCPELARIGAGDKVSDAVKALTAEGQAETFLERVCPEEATLEVQHDAQRSFLAAWQQKCNALLIQLERVPKTDPSSRSLIIELHERLERMDRDLRRLSIAASLGKNAASREDKLRLIARTYVEDAQLVFATLSGSGSSILTKNSNTGDTEGCLFDTVVIDEAAQATETSCLIPMTLGCSRCLLVGDPQQLPATVLSSGAAGLAYGQSLLERVFRAGLSVQLLDTQYRMHPAISSFPRRYFYNGRLKDDESVQGENRARAFHRDEIKPKLGPYVFLDISEGVERRSRDDRSIFNPAEAELASLIYTKLKKDYPTMGIFTPAGKAPGSVQGFGVVTPYKRQMQELRQSFERAGIPTGDIEIDTVDSYQGREKDVVVFSCVRTYTADRGIGFVRDVRRMNVGLTRARSTLIILGSAQALSEGSSDWAELVEDANSRGCLISVTKVGRCLLPNADNDDNDNVVTSPISKVNNNDLEENNVTNNVMLQNGMNYGGNENNVVGHMAKTFTKRSQPNHPADPRRRVHRPVQRPDMPVQQGYNPVENNVLNGSVQQQATLSEGIAGAIPSDIDENDPHSMLTAIFSALRRSGCDYSAQMEETLREHVRNGGQIDIETVLAAAIATGGQSKSDEGEPEVEKLVLNEQGLRSIGVEDRVGDVPNMIVDTVGDENMFGAVVKTEEVEENEIVEPLPGPKKKEEVKALPAKTKELKVENGKQKKSSSEPSGWELLFGGDGGDRGTKRGHEEEGDVQKRGRVTEEWDESEAGEIGRGMGLEINGRAAGPRGLRDEDGDGRSGRGRGRGRVRSRGRGRRGRGGRGRGQGFNGNDGDVRDNGIENEEWGGAGTAMGGYEGEGAGANAAAMVAMYGNLETMQAMQQQAIQQQAIQQQQMQQQMFSHSAFQTQAALQHQAALQQHLQQQMMMRMGMGGNDGGGMWYTGGFDQGNGNGGFGGGNENRGGGSGPRPFRGYRGSRGRGGGRGGGGRGGGRRR